VQSLDKAMEITDIVLVEKTGGKSGTSIAEGRAEAAR